MGGQVFDRREVVRLLGIAAVAGTFPRFSQWAFAGATSDDPASVANASGYERLFFSPADYRLIDHLVEMIIPGDGTPGARDAGVAEFIDFMVANRVAVTDRATSSQDTAAASDPHIQEEWLSGLSWMNMRATFLYGAPFLDVTAEQQHAILEPLAFRAKAIPELEVGRQFFTMLRDYTVIGYYTSKVGLETLGYPGLETFWHEKPACPHQGNPEHLGLTSAIT